MNAFNAALDQCKGDRNEATFAREEFGITDDTLRAYRRRRFPKGIDKIVLRPDLLRALAEDAEQSIAQPA